MQILFLQNGDWDKHKVNLSFLAVGQGVVPRLFSCCNTTSGLLDSWICIASKEQETSGEKKAFSEASTISRSRESLANKALSAR